jgi:hypothetical protein
MLIIAKRDARLTQEPLITYYLLLIFVVGCDEKPELRVGIDRSVTPAVRSHSGWGCSDTDLVNCAFLKTSQMRLMLYRKTVIARTDRFCKADT